MTGAIRDDYRGRPLVDIDTGTLRGVTVPATSGSRGNRTFAWRGIPYAAPPVGELRWRAPAPAPSFSGIRESHEFGFAAPQNTKYTAIGFRKYQPTDEDCLTLNVVAPARPASRPRPVMVFIHGGAYLMGSSATPLYLGHSLAERGDVVFVSINYRLGALGYLDLTEYSTVSRPIDGNLGLRDQLAALEWVQRNIAAFGGNPDNVTVFGESAGGNAVTTLLATPAAKGLFHRAIAESSAPGLTVERPVARSWATEYVEILGGPDALFAADSKTLGKAGNILMAELGRRQLSLVPYGPTVDGDLLPADPAVTLAAGSGHAVPLIIGTNRSEATLFTKMPGVGRPTAERVAHALGSTVTGIAPLTGLYPDFPSPHACARVLGDQLFWAPSVRLAEAHSRHAPVHFYRYDFAPSTLRAAGFGATHASELMAVFGSYRGPAGRLLALGDRGPALRVTGEVQRDWITFARTGRPASEWPEYRAGARATRIIDRRSRVEYDPAADIRRAWEESGLPGTARVPR